MSISEAENLPGRAEFLYQEDPEAEATQERMEKKLGGILRRLGCWAYSRIRCGNGASIHYAGTLPWGRDAGSPVEVDGDGRLAAMPGVYIGDSATWRFLPAKGLTLTLMANALRIADRIHEDLNAS